VAGRRQATPAQVPHAFAHGYVATVDWDDLRFVLMVSRHGTLSAAAKQLGVTQPTVGRRIAAIERRLGAKLFERRPGGLARTSAGASVAEHAERMETDALAAERRVAGADEAVRGTVRVTASEWLVTGVLAPALAPLLARHPGLTVELVADTRHLSLSRREADIAIRPRRFDAGETVKRALGTVAFGLYASRPYLAARGTPRVGDGKGHVLVAMTDDVGDVAREWLRDSFAGADVAVRTNGRDAMVALAVAGVGLACLGRVVGDRVPELVRVATAPVTPTLWLGMHRDVRRTRRVRAVVAQLVGAMGAMRERLDPPGP
jgi:molybdate transport repressor ModE-like protein